MLHTQHTSGVLHRLRLVTAVLEQTEHLEGVVLMPVRERIGAVVRIDFALLADRHARQTGAALRVKPLAAPFDVTVGAQSSETSWQRLNSSITDGDLPAVGAGRLLTFAGGTIDLTAHGQAASASRLKNSQPCQIFSRSTVSVGRPSLAFGGVLQV